MATVNRGIPQRLPNGHFQPGPKVEADLPPIFRFFAKVNISEGCWAWTAYCNKDGYGVLSVDGRTVLAHDFAYEAFVGPIPEGLEPDHLCRNPSCVNPAHLELVSHHINMSRGDHYAMGSSSRAKTHCPQGHPYDEKNTYVRPNDPYKRRHCRLCNRAKALDYWHRKHQEVSNEL